MLLSLIALLPALATAAKVQTFKPPTDCPTCTSNTSYVGQSNGSLPIQPVVPGHAYDRFITVWMENTDFESAAASPTFQKIAAQGILLTNYNGVTHPSEPNYVAAMTGDFFGMGDDDNYYLPYNVSSLVDLLELKNISWASYQENMPTDGFASDFNQTNYINSSAPNYVYYKRKHNPHIITNTVAGFPDRALRVRNFNDFAVDVNASALPQHVWVTPNMVNDAHDTDVNFMSAWLEFWLLPLLQNPLFNDNRTLIQLTFDETESYSIQNTVYTVLLGGAVPESLRGSKDSTFYTHYSMLSSVENNWHLPSLGRQDANKTMASVWAFQANQTNHTNYVPQASEIPLLNLTGIFPGVANSALWTPVLAPDVNAVGAGNGSVFYNTSSTDLELTSFAAFNLSATTDVNPAMVNPNFTYVGNSVVNESSPAAVSAAVAASSPASTSSKPASAAGVSSVSSAAAACAIVFAVAALL